LPQSEAKDQNPFLLKTVDPALTIDLVVGLSKVLVFKDPPKRIQMDTDERTGIAGYTIITDRELSLRGQRPGQTVLNLWFADPKDATKTVLYSYLVRVAPDPSTVAHVRQALEAYYKQLEKELNCAFPNSRVCLNIVGNRLIISGQAHDVFEAAQIFRIIAPRTQVGGIQQTGKGLTTAVEHGLARSTITKMPDVPPEESEKSDTGDATNPYFRGGLQVINLMRVPGEQQVMLKVVVAEVDRAAARSIGLNFSIKNSQGQLVVANLTGVGVQSSAIGGALSMTGANLPVFLDNGQISLAITALKNRNLARTLAEPTLVALNGQSASFSAGGEFPVPIVTGFTAAGLQGVSFVPYGVQLQFTPVITDKDRIRLTVNANVSTRDLSASANVSGTNVPGLNVRQFQTVVELRGGETMAVAGLIQKDYGADSTRIPLLGDIPVIGRLFGSSDKSSAGEQELVMLITPMLAAPLDPAHTRPLPGSDVIEPSDLEFYVHGYLESHQPVDYRSPVRTDLLRMQQYQEELRQINPQGVPQTPPMNINHPIPPKGNSP
jgi:pilus assembly protein CpaC